MCVALVVSNVVLKNAVVLKTLWLANTAGSPTLWFPTRRTSLLGEV